VVLQAILTCNTKRDQWEALYKSRGFRQSNGNATVCDD